MGLGQAWVLRNAGVAKWGWWIPLTILGWTIVTTIWLTRWSHMDPLPTSDKQPVDMMPRTIEAPLALQLVGPFLLGACQWPLLRYHVRCSSLWILVTGAALMLAFRVHPFAAILYPLGTAYFLRLFWKPRSQGR